MALSCPIPSTGHAGVFSDDDGLTWFADDATRLAPWDHNGKQAVVAKVYQTAAGKQFIAYLIKFTDRAHDAAILAQKNQKPQSGPSTATETGENTLLVKKPREKDWVPANDPKAREIMTVKPPDGSSDYTIVRPE